MREILFRGKRVDNGKWVEGSLYYDPDLEQSQIYGFNYTYNNETGEERECFHYLVIPETVGQYTGLTDKNGKMIYENDILNCEVVGIQYPAKVVFKNGSFGVAYTHIGIDYFNPFTSYVESVEFEIIGNIYGEKQKSDNVIENA